MPGTATASGKRRPLTLAQVAAYDDILTDALVDHTYYWTTIPKNRPSYHPSRGIREEEIAKLIQTHIILDRDLATAEKKLLATDGLRKFYNSLKTDKEKEDFRAHLRRYMSIYLPDCPFEVNATNRYTIVTHEASITARRFIKPNETIKYLAGIQVLITPEEEAEMALRKKDFSIVVSSRNKCASLFMGPARFANHDCDANARLVTRGQSSIEIIACRPIDVGDEITVTYGDNYFGEDNCECLCQTCEQNLANGWKSAEGGSVAVTRSIEDDPSVAAQGYLLRRRRREDSACRVSSRTPSVTPDIRPRVPKRSKSYKNLADRASTATSLAPETDLARLVMKRKSEVATLATPPVTPAKRQKTNLYEIVPVDSSLVSPSGSCLTESEQSTAASPGSQDEALLTEATSSDELSPELVPNSPQPTPVKAGIPTLKQEDSADEVQVQDVPEAVPSTPVPGAGPPQTHFSTPISSGASPAQDVSTAALGSESVDNLRELQETKPGSDNATRQDPSSASHALPAPAKRRCGRPRKRVFGQKTTAETRKGGVQVESGDSLPMQSSASTQRARSGSRSSSRPPSRQRQRVPGDYTLTPLLLSEPNMAWIHCTICGAAFVQQNAYYTRSSCPRCERHSKLYGYMWPKTEPAGRWDDEEQILDHREVHRFLAAEDEAKVRGRKYWKDLLKEDRESESVDRQADQEEDSVVVGPRRRNAPAKRGRRKKRASTEDDDNDGMETQIDPDAASGLRRSGRVRKASVRSVGLDIF
ncbi:hypothetical protein VTK73DRAFT_3208 [Phialemonium thermophilum]|uniref:Histone-lysine N-methyltransferase SET9 n=1 Tax=Phialemonium thermophilum TaxID=223376 RepID=A0ABR3WZW8_9PEZI